VTLCFAYSYRLNISQRSQFPKGIYSSASTSYGSQLWNSERSLGLHHDILALTKNTVKERQYSLLSYMHLWP